MPAVPAWPPRTLPRLYVAQALLPGAEVRLEDKPAHYLANVLRLGGGDRVLLFDGHSGEWVGRIVEVAKKRIVLTVDEQTRPLEALPDLTLAFALIKRAPLEWLVEKATELGVAKLQPVITRRTVVERLNLDRLRLITIEAAEQCGRTRLPEIGEVTKLEALVQQSPPQLLFADETGGAAIIGAVTAGPAIILIGPEGGFTPEERDSILAHGAKGISLGPRILRAETAALAAVSLYMAAAGDWR